MYHYLFFFIVGLLIYSASLSVNLSDANQRQRQQIRRLEKKLDLLLANHGLALPVRTSAEVESLARAGQKIAAIKLHRELNPHLGLAEAKAEVEEII